MGCWMSPSVPESDPRGLAVSLLPSAYYLGSPVPRRQAGRMLTLLTVDAYTGFFRPALNFQETCFFCALGVG